MSETIRRLGKFLDGQIEASTLIPIQESKVRSEYGIEVVKRQFSPNLIPGPDRFVQSFQAWLGRSHGSKPQSSRFIGSRRLQCPVVS